MLKIPFYIPVPDFLARLGVWTVLLYRKIRFGYAYRRLPLSNGKYAIVDLEDFDKFSQYKWQATKSSWTFYAKRSEWLNGKRINVQLHREIMQPPKHLIVDHINRNGLDNRRANLRIVTTLQNSWNSERGKNQGSSKYKGVYRSKERNKWKATLCHKGRKIPLGYFENEAEAAKAYDKAAKEARGEFAVLNFKENSSQYSAFSRQ